MSRHLSDPTPNPGRGSAEVIPFPASAPQAQVRLERALTRLQDALAIQAAAVAEWRGALSNLDAACNNLDRSFVRARTELDSLGSKVAGLRDQSRALVAWAEAHGG